MQATIQSSPAFELRADLTRTEYGHHLQLFSFIPIARAPEQQVRFQGLLSDAELRAFRDLINRALDAQPAPQAGAR